jgi:hypothetical protein
MDPTDRIGHIKLKHLNEEHLVCSRLFEYSFQAEAGEIVYVTLILHITQELFKPHWSQSTMLSVFSSQFFTEA